MSEHFSFPINIFFDGALLQYLVYLVLIVIIIFRLINYNNRFKTSVCIHHMSLATFTTLAMVANTCAKTGCKVYLRKGELVRVQCGLYKNFKGLLKIQG